VFGGVLSTSLVVVVVQGPLVVVVVSGRCVDCAGALDFAGWVIFGIGWVSVTVWLESI